MTPQIEALAQWRLVTTETVAIISVHLVQSCDETHKTLWSAVRARQ
jgi:hypothetical protein